MEELNSKPKGDPKYVIVGINIAIMVAYTVYLRFVDQGHLNAIVVAILIAAHFVLCLVLAIFGFRREFLLSAAMVLVIGFSTCLLVFSIR